MKLNAALGALMLLVSLTFALAAQAQDYRVQPGDVLRIEVIEDPTLNRSVLVPPDGRIIVPLAGSVQAGGRAVSQIQNDLKAKLAPNFAAPPNVFVSIEQIFEEPDATVDIYVLGEVAKPGLTPVLEGTTVLQLFAQMGGFSKFAATKRIQLRRTDRNGQEKVYLINYDDIEQGDARTGATVLREGDVIIVPQRRLFE